MADDMAPGGGTGPAAPAAGGPCRAMHDAIDKLRAEARRKDAEANEVLLKELVGGAAGQLAGGTDVGDLARSAIGVKRMLKGKKQSQVLLEEVRAARARADQLELYMRGSVNCKGWDPRPVAQFTPGTGHGSAWSTC
jgi:hypothetical protein